MKKILSIFGVFNLSFVCLSNLESCGKSTHKILDNNLANWNIHSLFQNQVAMEKISKNIKNANITNQTIFRDKTGQGRDIEDVWKNNWPGGDNPVINDPQLEYANLTDIGESFILLYERGATNSSNSIFANLNNNDALKLIDDNFNIYIESQSYNGNITNNLNKYNTKYDASNVVYGSDGEWQTVTPKQDNVTTKYGPIIYMDYNDSGQGSQYLAFYFSIEVKIKNDHKIFIKNEKGDNVDVWASKNGFYEYKPYWSVIKDTNGNPVNNTRISIGYQVNLPIF